MDNNFQIDLDILGGLPWIVGLPAVALLMLAVALIPGFRGSSIRRLLWRVLVQVEGVLFIISAAVGYFNSEAPIFVPAVMGLIGLACTIFPRHIGDATIAYFDWRTEGPKGKEVIAVAIAIAVVLGWLVYREELMEIWNALQKK